MIMEALSTGVGTERGASMAGQRTAASNPTVCEASSRLSNKNHGSVRTRVPTVTGEEVVLYNGGESAPEAQQALDPSTVRAFPGRSRWGWQSLTRY